MKLDNLKNKKAHEIIIRKASEFIQRESNGQSLVTVTNLISSKDNKKITIYFTVFPVHKEAAVTDFLKRQRSNFKEYIKSNTRLNLIPQFDFEIDLGEKSRQRVDELL